MKRKFTKYPQGYVKASRSWNGEYIKLSELLDFTIIHGTTRVVVTLVGTDYDSEPAFEGTISDLGEQEEFLTYNVMDISPNGNSLIISLEPAGPHRQKPTSEVYYGHIG